MKHRVVRNIWWRRYSDHISACQGPCPSFRLGEPQLFDDEVHGYRFYIQQADSLSVEIDPRSVVRDSLPIDIEKVAVVRNICHRRQIVENRDCLFDFLHPTSAEIIYKGFIKRVIDHGQIPTIALVQTLRSANVPW